MCKLRPGLQAWPELPICCLEGRSGRAGPGGWAGNEAGCCGGSLVLPRLPGLAWAFSLPVLLGEGVPVGWVGVSGSHVPATHGGEWGEQQGWKEGKGSAVLYPACCSRLPLFPSCPEAC